MVTTPRPLHSRVPLWPAVNPLQQQPVVVYPACRKTRSAWLSAVQKGSCAHIFSLDFAHCLPARPTHPLSSRLTSEKRDEEPASAPECAPVKCVRVRCCCNEPLCVAAPFWAKMTFLQSRGRLNTSYLSPLLSIALTRPPSVFPLISPTVFWRCVCAQWSSGAARLNTNTCTRTYKHSERYLARQTCGVNISCVASQRCGWVSFFMVYWTITKIQPMSRHQI